MMFKASRPRDYFRLLVHDDMAATVRKHDVWDMLYDEETRTVLISPGRHKRRSGKGGYCASLSGISTSDIHRDRLEYKNGLQFGGLDQYAPMPIFGLMDVIMKIDDDESMSFVLPPLHRLPWLKPFKVACWSVETTAELLRARLASALAAGIPHAKVMSEIAIPDMVHDYLGPEVIARVIRECVSSASSGAGRSASSPGRG